MIGRPAATCVSFRCLALQGRASSLPGADKEAEGSLHRRVLRRPGGALGQDGINSSAQRAGCPGRGRETGQPDYRRGPEFLAATIFCRRPRGPGRLGRGPDRLQRAAQVSPNNTMRQRLVGDIAVRTGDLLAAESRLVRSQPPRFEPGKTGTISRILPGTGRLRRQCRVLPGPDRAAPRLAGRQARGIGGTGDRKAGAPRPMAKGPKRANLRRAGAAFAGTSDGRAASRGRPVSQRVVVDLALCLFCHRQYGCGQLDSSGGRRKQRGSTPPGPDRPGFRQDRHATRGQGTSWSR